MISFIDDINIRIDLLILFVHVSVINRGAAIALFIVIINSMVSY